MLCFAACRNGSQLVKEVREKKDKDKSRLRFWDMAGSKMGQITGLTNEEQDEAQKRAEEQVRLDVGTSNGTLRIGRR
jgi:pre-mRNA-splicing factor ATP-dependent RNA helicase DHX38/PRP16